MSLGAQIRSARKSRDITQQALADQLGISVQAISQWEQDRTVPTYDRLVLLRQILGIEVGADPEQEPGEWKSTVTTAAAEVGMLPVIKIGKTAAGVFREVDDFDQSEPERIWEPADQRFPYARRMALEVEGDSVNDLKPRPIMDGDVIICVAFEDVANEVKVRDGLVVVVQRTRDGGHTREWSVKQVELYEDRVEFHPRSTNRRHKPIVVKRETQADDGVQVEIIALVRSVRSDMPF